MKRKGCIFLLLEKFNGSKYPTFIKDILKETAFDTEAALKTLEKSSVEKIEQIVTENTDLVKNTVYVNHDGSLKISPFKFLLGHKNLILAIPIDLQKYLQSKLEQKNAKRVPDIKNLKVLLTDKIKKYIESKKLDFTVQSDDLTNFSTSGNRVRCLARCPFCSIKVPCVYNSSWKNSNYNKHIVNCFNKEAQKNTVKNSLENSSVKIQRARDSDSVNKIIAEVNNVAR